MDKSTLTGSKALTDYVDMPTVVHAAVIVVVVLIVYHLLFHAG